MCPSFLYLLDLPFYSVCLFIVQVSLKNMFSLVLKYVKSHVNILLTPRGYKKSEFFYRSSTKNIFLITINCLKAHEQFRGLIKLVYHQK